jgi:hypothetical protein
LAKALIQGDEQGYFADKACSDQAFLETLERRGPVAAPSTRSLAEAVQRLVLEHSLRRRARPCNVEALVRYDPRPRAHRITIQPPQAI